MNILLYMKGKGNLSINIWHRWNTLSNTQRYFKHFLLFPIHDIESRKSMSRRLEKKNKIVILCTLFCVVALVVLAAVCAALFWPVFAALL